jgi:purine nucleoside permease
MSKYASLANLNEAKAAYYEQLARTLALNAGNLELSDSEFRGMVRNSISEFARPAPPVAAEPGTAASQDGGEAPAVQAARVACADICEQIALKHQQKEGTYAAGKKAGAFECCEALRADVPKPG